MNMENFATDGEAHSVMGTAAEVEEEEMSARGRGRGVQAFSAHQCSALGRKNLFMDGGSDQITTYLINNFCLMGQVESHETVRPCRSRRKRRRRRRPGWRRRSAQWTQTWRVRRGRAERSSRASDRDGERDGERPRANIRDEIQPETYSPHLHEAAASSGGRRTSLALLLKPARLQLVRPSGRQGYTYACLPVHYRRKTTRNHDTCITTQK